MALGTHHVLRHVFYHVIKACGVPPSLVLMLMLLFCCCDCCGLSSPRRPSEPQVGATGGCANGDVVVEVA